MALFLVLPLLTSLSFSSKKIREMSLFLLLPMLTYLSYSTKKIREMLLFLVLPMLASLAGGKCQLDVLQSFHKVSEIEKC